MATFTPIKGDPFAPKRKPNVAADLAKAAASGAGRAGLSLLGGRGDLIDIAANGLINIGETTGLLSADNAGAARAGVRDFRLRPSSGVRGLIRQAVIGPAGVAPTTAELVAATPGAGYRAETAPGRYAGAVGEGAIAAALPGGAIRRAANVAAPALAGEGAADIAGLMGAGDRGKGAARFAGGLIAGAGASGGLRIRLRPAADEAAGMREATDALTEAGVDVRAVSMATMDRIRMQVRQGRSAREAAIGIVANDELPVPLPLSRGERSGAPGQQLAENMMLRGAKGSAAARQMRGFKDEQQAALRGNVDAIGAGVAGGPLPARGAGVARAAERLNTMYDTADDGVNGAYRAAREATGDVGLPREERFTISSRLKESLTSHDELRVPSVFREVDRLGQASKLGPKELFDARSRLVMLQRSNDGVEGGAASAAKRSLDGYINEALDRDLFAGDAEAVRLWREAIGQRRDFGRMFEGGDLVEKLTQRTSRGGETNVNLIDPNDAANYILGRSDMGFVGKQNLNRDLNRLRGALGEQSPEWNGLRGEVFQRIASQGESGVEFGQRQFSGVKFQKAWEDFQRKDPQLAQGLFTDAERAQINRFAVLAARATNPVKGGDNNSNTSVAAMRLLGNLKFLRGLPFLKDLTNEVEVQVNFRDARNATSETISPAPRTRGSRIPTVEARNLSGGLIVGGLATAPGLLGAQ